MARKHVYDDHGEFGVDLGDEIEWLENATDAEATEKLASIGLNDDIVDEAIAAAQAILDKYKSSSFVAAIEVEGLDEEILEKCQCGSRCVARGCKPYTRCRTSNGRRTCVTGHRKYCTRRACNPC